MRTAGSVRRKRIVLLACSLALALVIGEGLLRVFDYSYSPLEIEVAGQQADWRFHHAFRDRNFEFDPERIWRPRHIWRLHCTGHS